MNKFQISLLFTIFIICVNDSALAETVAKSICPSGQTFNPIKARKHQLKIFDLDEKNEAIIMRYLNATQGTPPDFSKFPNHKAFYAREPGGQLCDGDGCTPEPTGAIIFTDDKSCVIYQIDGPVSKLNKIVIGKWSLSIN